MVNENINILDTPVPNIKEENLLKPTKYRSKVKRSKNTGNRAKRAENLKKK